MPDRVCSDIDPGLYSEPDSLFFFFIIIFVFLLHFPFSLLFFTFIIIFFFFSTFTSSPALNRAHKISNSILDTKYNPTPDTADGWMVSLAQGSSPSSLA